MVMASPFTTSAAPYFYSGAVLTISLSVFEDQISDPLQRETIEARPLGWFATRVGEFAGAMVPNVIYIVIMFGNGLWKHDRQSLRRAKVMWNSSLFSVIAANLIKVIILEPRPDGSDRFSFPSGHTTAAFSFAAAIGAIHGWALGVPAYAYSLLVAYGRMNDNRHYLHDIVGAATIAISYAIAARDRSEIRLQP